MTEPIMRKVNGDGITIQLAVWEGNESQVLCVHGLTANCRCWDVIASSLAPENTISAIDLRGRGLSERPSAGYSMRHHIRDIHCVLDDLEQEKMILMGHSLGAFISLAFAAHCLPRATQAASEPNRTFQVIRASRFFFSFCHSICATKTRVRYAVERISKAGGPHAVRSKRRHPEKADEIT